MTISSASAVSDAFVAGKNKLINGDLYHNQRNFTSTTVGNAYGFDRWQLQTSGSSTTTYSAQTFTPGTAPVAGYEGKNFARILTTANSDVSTAAVFGQRLEDARTFAGQTVTVSFWAKAASGTPSITIELYQYFGSGGTPSADVSAIGVVKQALTTSWARYAATITVPSVSGQTFGSNNDSQFQLNIWCSAGSNFNTRSNTLGIQANTFDFWGLQMEAGTVATAFTTASGSIGGELALCQRYLQKIGPNGGGAYFNFCNAAVEGTTTLWGTIPLPVTMRTTPSGNIVSSGSTYTVLGAGNFGSSSFFVDAAQSGPSSITFGSNALSGLTLYQSRYIRVANDSTGTYILLSAEL
jgi:hypothetical protein